MLPLWREPAPAVVEGVLDAATTPGSMVSSHGIAVSIDMLRRLEASGGRRCGCFRWGGVLLQACESAV